MHICRFDFDVVNMEDDSFFSWGQVFNLRQGPKEQKNYGPHESWGGCTDSPSGSPTTRHAATSFIGVHQMSLSRSSSPSLVAQRCDIRDFMSDSSPIYRLLWSLSSQHERTMSMPCSALLMVVLCRRNVTDRWRPRPTRQFMTWNKWSAINYTVSQNVPTLWLSLTLSNLNRFSKFLHCWKAWWNLLSKTYGITHLTLGTFLHYLGKVKIQIFCWCWRKRKEIAF